MDSRQRGVHCCGNTDWSVLLRCNTDIINYDAFNFLETIFYFREDLASFLAKGGQVSPGIVPTSEAVLTTSTQDILSLWNTFNGRMDEVHPKGDRSGRLVTTSCGLGSLTGHEARRAMELLKEFASITSL